MRLDRSTTLDNGLRVRLRLPLPSDRARLRDFQTRLGLDVDDLSTGRLVRFDPRTRTALCATVFSDRNETLVGFGAIEHSHDAPFVLLADEQRAPGVRSLLADGLRAHAGRRVA